MNQHREIDVKMVKNGATDKSDGTVGIISHNVAKTIRSEHLNKDKTNNCEITDMFNKKMDKSLTNNKQFVIEVITRSDYPKKTRTGEVETNEFAVLLLHEDIVQVLQRCNESVLELNVDSTGSLVRDPTCHEKFFHNQSRILNHNVVARINGVTFPIVEMVGSMANTQAVSYMMRAIEDLFHKIPNCKIKFLVFVSDWAPQNFNSAVQILNKMSLINYINHLYTNTKIIVPFPTYIMSCVSHFVHAISKYCTKHLSPTQMNTKSIIIQLFTSIMLAQTYDEAFLIVEEALFIFFTKYNCKELTERKVKLLKAISKSEIREIIKTANDEADKFHFGNKPEESFEPLLTDSPIETKKETKMDSLCYKRFLAISSKAIAEAATATANATVFTPNTFYDENEKSGVLFRLLDLKMAYLPLFNNSQYIKLNRKQRPSNGVIENHHSEIKNGELMSIYPRSLSNYVSIRQQSLTNKIVTTSEPDIWNLVKHGRQRTKKPFNNVSINFDQFHGQTKNLVQKMRRTNDNI